MFEKGRFVVPQSHTDKMPSLAWKRPGVVSWQTPARGGFCMETWKDIEGLESSYQVSNLGRVRSLNRYIEHGRPQDRPTLRFCKGRILKPTGTRYASVTLYKNRTAFTRRIHRLVASAFLTPPPTEYIHVNHKDGDKANNRVDNLEWCTATMNAWHAYHILNIHPFHYVKGEQHYAAKLTKDQVLEIRRLYATGLYTQTKLAELFPVNIAAINHIVTRKRWKHI